MSDRLSTSIFFDKNYIEEKARINTRYEINQNLLKIREAVSQLRENPLNNRRVLFETIEQHLTLLERKI